MDDAIVRLKLLLNNELSTPFLQAKKHFNGGIDEMRGKLSDFKQAQRDTFKGMQDEIPGMNRAASLLANPYVAAAAAVISVGTGFVYATKLANDWAEKMAHANVTAQLSRKELHGLSYDLLDIGGSSSGDLNSVPDAFNRIISANVSVNDALKATQPTLKAAKAGWADIETTAAAGVGVMKASGEDINRVYDILFATVNKGNAEFKDIAQYLPKIVPTARKVGFALYETAGAWAYLTAQGMSSERSTTLMENGLKVLGQLDKVKTFKKMGVEIYDLHTGKVKPFIDIIDQMVKKTKGLTDLGRMRYFSKLGLDTEAASFFASATQNAKELRGTIDFTRDSQGQLNMAFENAKTPLDDWKEALNGIKVELIKVGDAILPTLTTMGKWVKEQISILATSMRTLHENIGYVENKGSKQGDEYINSIKSQFGKTINTDAEFEAAMAKVQKKRTDTRIQADFSSKRENNYKIPLLSNDWLETKGNQILKSSTFGLLGEKPLGLRTAEEIKTGSTGYHSWEKSAEASALLKGQSNLPSDWAKFKATPKSKDPLPTDPNGNQ